ncbi:hypothetical protein CFK37_06060 [Virgibacillus phasianinus]|uniref:CAAX prenyl protease 2/Lysostaphin resistance protein A-like domain-containing protein n=1 Tax=Virgibacillus phasianinus TaxID=2017483 RepID=A0A220U0V6_9BACI|nr:hypothetical protein CFK37_06060 [Virgibacillus phasianinus]
MYFRELLIGQLRKYIPVWICVLFSVIFFASGHDNYPLFGLVLGIAFTFLYLYTNSWTVSFATHSVWNLYIVLVGILS